MTYYSTTYGKAVLRALNAPYNGQTDRFMRAWAQSESATARWNPWATTARMPGSTTTRNPNGTLNSAGVQDYLSWEQGVQATVKTLLNGRYGPLVAAMRSGKSSLAMALALKASPWGTGALAERIIRSGRIPEFPIGNCYPVPRTSYDKANGPILPGDVGADVDELLRALGNTAKFYDGDPDDPRTPVGKVVAHQRKRWPLLGNPDGIVGPLSYRSITGHW